MKLWFRVDSDSSTDLKIEQLGDMLGVQPSHAFGLLAGVWCGVARHAEHGDLTGIGDGAIEAWARWHGKRGKFAASFRTLFVDPDGVLHGWRERQGSLIERMAKDRKRQRDKYRQAKERIDALSDGTSTETSTENGGIIRGVSAPTLTITEQNSTSVVVGSAPIEEAIPKERQPVAVLLTSAANQGITAKYGEQPTPLRFSHPGSLEAADEILSRGVPVLFARDAFYSAAQRCQLVRPPSSLKYFLRQVVDAWDMEQSRTQAKGATTPKVIALSAAERRAADTRSTIEELLAPIPKEMRG
jgi:hypothetical protein